MNLLEQKSRAIYNDFSRLAPFSYSDFETFIKFMNSSLSESRFLNPFKFSDEYSLDYDTCLSILLFFTNTDEPILTIRPVIECLNSHCKDLLFIIPEEQFVECTECDEDYDITQNTRYLKFLFEINPQLFEKYKMSLQTNSYDKIKSLTNGLKHSPPSSIYKVSERELEGGVGYKKLVELNNSTTAPISTPFSDIQKKISKDMSKI